MTRAPRRYCSNPDCDRLLGRGETCPDHPPRPRKRPRTKARGYGGDWQRLRKRVLAAEPWCRPCALQGVLTPATEVDHIVPISQGGARLDPGNLQAICTQCHAEKTRADQKA